MVLMYSNTLILDILDYIEQNLNRKITIEELSHVFYFHKDYIMRLFKKELQTTIMDYINQKRIYYCLEELGKTEHSILQISLHHGFYSQEYFCEVFHKILGVSPTTYRKFTKINSNITEEELQTIRNTLPFLVAKIQQVEEYKRNRKTKEQKTLSLFH